MKIIPKKQNNKKTFVYLVLYLITASMIFSVFLFHPQQTVDFPVLRTIIITFASILLGKYFLYMLLSPWHDLLVVLRDRKYRRQLKSFNPRVSVMVPAWNESVGVLMTVKTILKSTHRNLEIIVVNDGSTDDSDKLMSEFKAKYDAENPESEDKIDIVYHYKKNGGKGSALNTAIELATGDILISIDADCVITPNTIKNFTRPFVDPKVMAAVGNVKVGNTQNVLGVVQYLEFLFSFYFKKADSVMNTIYIIGGAAGAFRRETIQAIGGYNTTNITEDIELSVRIQNAGMKIVYVDNALVYTEGASDINGLMKQRLRWKRGRFETFFQHKHIFFSTKKKHNKFLSWFILPFGWFGEVQLCLEPFFILFLYIYSAIIHDFSSFISGIIIVGFMFFVQIFFDDKNTRHLSFLGLLPIGWLLFYVTTFVEFNALFKSIMSMIRKKEIKWQRWQRKGVYG